MPEVGGNEPDAGRNGKADAKQEAPKPAPAIAKKPTTPIPKIIRDEKEAAKWVEKALHGYQPATFLDVKIVGKTVVSTTGGVKTIQLKVTTSPQPDAWREFRTEFEKLLAAIVRGQFPDRKVTHLSQTSQDFKNVSDFHKLGEFESSGVLKMFSRTSSDRYWVVLSTARKHLGKRMLHHSWRAYEIPKSLQPAFARIHEVQYQLRVRIMSSKGVVLADQTRPLWSSNRPMHSLDILPESNKRLVRT